MKLDDQNILFLVRTMGIGGTENVVIQLCEILLEKVNKIVVCSSGGIQEDKLKKLGIKHYTIPDVSSKNPVDMMKVIKRLFKIIKEEEITIIHSHHRMAAFYVELLAKKHIIKVANVHNTFFDKKKTTRFAYRNTKLIAVGNMVKNNLIEYFEIPNSQICVIHNAVKPFNKEINPIQLLTTAKAAGFVLVGNIGRLSEQKGMTYFIEAAELVLKECSEVRFYIVGDGEEKASLQEQIIKKHLEDRVYLMGYRNDIQNVMAQLDFIVLSSLWEGLPLTPIEAYSVGKTVIGTAVDGTPEVIRNNIDGYLVGPKNSIELAQKIVFLVKNPKVRERLEGQAKKRYLSDFSFTNMAEKYLSFYKDIIGDEKLV